MAELGLMKAIQLECSPISGRSQQRVAIARSLVSEAQLF